MWEPASASSLGQFFSASIFPVFTVVIIIIINFIIITAICHFFVSTFNSELWLGKTIIVQWNGGFARTCNLKKWVFFFQTHRARMHLTLREKNNSP